MERSYKNDFYLKVKRRLNDEEFVKVASTIDKYCEEYKINDHYLFEDKGYVDIYINSVLPEQIEEIISLTGIVATIFERNRSYENKNDKIN